MSKLKIEIDENNCCHLYLNDELQECLTRINFHADTTREYVVDFEQLIKEQCDYKNGMIVTTHKRVKIAR